MTCNFIKKTDPGTGVFLRISLNVWEWLYGTPPVAASECGWIISKNFPIWEIFA